jgi:hypothetical protein
LADDLVGFLAFDVGNKAHAARVMLVARIVKALFRRLTHKTPRKRLFSGTDLLPAPFLTRKSGQTCGIPRMTNISAFQELQRNMTERAAGLTLS